MTRIEPVMRAAAAAAYGLVPSTRPTVKRKRPAADELRELLKGCGVPEKSKEDPSDSGPPDAA